jgi:ABC-type antimicrobial peptide transport system permease subunit
VAQRRREIGVRMALGALPEQILRQFLGLGTRLLFVGIGVGGVGAYFAGRWMQSLLFEVAPFNGFVFGVTAALLAVVVLLASLLPSRRAAHTPPIEALRAD